MSGTMSVSVKPETNMIISGILQSHLYCAWNNSCTNEPGAGSGEPSGGFSSSSIEGWRKTRRENIYVSFKQQNNLQKHQCVLDTSEEKLHCEMCSNIAKLGYFEFTLKFAKMLWDICHLMSTENETIHSGTDV